MNVDESIGRPKKSLEIYHAERRVSAARDGRRGARTWLVALGCLACTVVLAAPRIAAQEAEIAAQEAPPAERPQILTFDPRDEKRDRVVPLKVYLPPQAKLEAVPVVLFSHGLGGSRDGASYLGKAWSAAGFVAVFLQHPGSDESVWRGVPLRDRMSAMQDAANGQQLMARIEDVSFTLDQLERWNGQAQHALAGRLNLQRIGMSGHSFGARTTQSVMGQRPVLGRRDARDERLDAFLILSPSMPEGARVERLFGEITAPVMCMTGTQDRSPLDRQVTPESRREVYTGFPRGNKFLVVFDDGEHSLFAGRSQRSARQDLAAIEQLTTAFWKAYLREDAEARAWLQSDSAREKLDPQDVYEWK